MRLPHLMVGVLPQNDYPHLVEWRLVECVENQRASRKALPCGVFMPHKLREVKEIGLLKLVCELLFPRLFYANVHLPRQL